MGTTVVVVIVVLRVLIPLAIPRIPLPAILAALVIDAADQTILAAFDAEPANYQGYDKALDVFYLAIAYLSTLRNWPSRAALGSGPAGQPNRLLVGRRHLDRNQAAAGILDPHRPTRFH